MHELTTQHLAAARRRLLARQMATDYQAGVTQLELSLRHNVSPGFVSTILNEAGVRRTHDTTWANVDWTYSDEQIAKAKGYTRQRVCQVRRKLGKAQPAEAGNK